MAENFPLYSATQIAAREEAVAKLREQCPQPHPWMASAGMFRGDPDFEQVLEIMAENRRKMDHDPAIP